MASSFGADGEINIEKYLAIHFWSPKTIKDISCNVSILNNALSPGDTSISELILV